MNKFYALLLLLFSTSVQATEFKQCVHLLHRASFGLDSTHLNRCLQQADYKASVSDLMLRPRNFDSIKAPKFAENILRKPKKNSAQIKTERKVYRAELHKGRGALKNGWFKEMLITDDPFLEKMVLFWHNHFTSSLQKVKQPALIYQQHQLIRKYALGNFAELTHAIIEDPAMLIYLDNQANKKSEPNENLARELLELFTLGEGNYTDNDVKEMARALTGYSLGKNLQFKFKKRIHNNSQKQLFGQKGDFNAHDMLDIILAQEATSIFIVHKLWLEFIGYHPDAKEVKRLAKVFRQNHYEIFPLMTALLNSPFFTDAQVRGTMFKSPIEIIIGTLRRFNYLSFDPQTGVRYAIRLGQNLFDPPNVKGWPKGKTWINANTLLLRKTFLNRLTREQAMQQISNQLFKSPAITGTLEEQMIKTLLPLPACMEPATNSFEALQDILQHPLYQLK